MAIHISIYSLPKQGHSPIENQDASWPQLPKKQSFKNWPPIKNKKLPKFIAIADGASEGLFSGIWARIIASRAKLAFQDNNLERILNGSLTAWARFMRRKTSQKANKGTPITRLPTWMEEPALEQGGFATLAAMQMTRDGKWSAIALGDSCVFQVRSDRLVFRFPISNTDDFNKRPHLLGSVLGIDKEAAKRIAITKKKKWKDGDRFYLMSDAMACWFLKQESLGEKPWTELNRLGTDAPDANFGDMVARWRENGEMRNDDVTLIRVDVK
ncbi:MAG: hypothetical protein WCL71_01880 [Deltaproteobacteria bacterium]|jgi:Protein phosphatase 2C